MSLFLLLIQASTYDIPKKEKRPRRWRSKNNGKETKATLQVNVQLVIYLLILNTNSFTRGIKDKKMIHFYLCSRSQAVSPPSPLACTPPTPISPLLSPTSRRSALNPQTRLQTCLVYRRTSAGWPTTVSSCPSLHKSAKEILLP